MSEILRTRRAPTACSWCRQRKVRCDAALRGCPCTRCRQDGRGGCSIRTNHRRSKPHSPRPKGPTGDPLKYYYPFIDSQFLGSLAPEDVAFLSAKGAGTLPGEKAVDEFVREYFKRIHPSVPMIAEGGFWDVYQSGGQDGDGKVSLFVFQAILFASCPFVSLDTLRRCGFANKRDARKQLYNRAKLLYDLNIDPRPSAKSQGSVLLSYHTSAEDPQAGSTWLGRAIENATLIDSQPSLSPSPVPASQISDGLTPSLKKRLWWSILLRDRSLCIGLRRRSQVPVDESRCEWLMEEDFGDEMHASRVYDYRQKKRLLGALQEQCRFAVKVAGLVELVFSSGGLPGPGSGFVSEDERLEGILGRIGSIRAGLVDWGVTELSKSTPKSGDGSESESEEDDPAAILTNLTAVYYHTSLVTLSQYTAFLIEGHHPFTQTPAYTTLKHQLGQDLQTSIEALVSCMEYFSQKGRLESLPLSVLGYVGMPLILTAIDLKLSPTHSALSARLARFNALTEIVKHAESCYEVTDFVAVGINYVLRLAYLTTRVVFRSRSRTGIASSRAVSRTQRWVEDQGKEDGEGKKNRGGTRGVVMKDGPKVTSWVDAFIVWPRAYLLISSSVDRSLAVGRLPSRQSLPELVRNIPAMGADFRLPWSVGSGQGGGERLERLEGRKRRRIGAVDEDCGRGQREDEVREEERQQEGNEKVNLNFLDLGAVSPGVVESEEEQEQQGEQQGEGEAGLEFDAALLDTISNELFMADVAT